MQAYSDARNQKNQKKRSNERIPGHSPAAPDLIAVRKFRSDMGVVASTIWRWIQRGWLPKPINIGGRLYFTREHIARFKERAARGDFASLAKPPVRNL